MEEVIENAFGIMLLVILGLGVLAIASVGIGMAVATVTDWVREQKRLNRIENGREK